MNSNFWNTVTSTGALNPTQIVQAVTGSTFLGAGIANLDGVDKPIGMAAGLGSGAMGLPAASGFRASGSVGSAASAGLGQATSVGPLSVPPSWSAVAPFGTVAYRFGVGKQPAGGASGDRGRRAEAVAPTGAGIRAGATTSIADNRFLIRREHCERALDGLVQREAKKVKSHVLSKERIDAPVRASPEEPDEVVPSGRECETEADCRYE